MIYNIKLYGSYKACMVVSVNMTGHNIDSYYASVISLCSMRTVVLLAELNNIDTRTGGISNAYLTAIFYPIMDPSLHPL